MTVPTLPAVDVLASRFGDALRVADCGTAEAVIEEALDLGIHPEIVQSSVIAPAMVRIGELWELGVLTVADEQRATAISERGLVRIVQSMRARRRLRPGRERVLLAAVEGQTHVLGLRMVADMLDDAGFEVQYLGADVPAASLRAFAADHAPAVVGLAYGMGDRIQRLAGSIAAIHDVAPDARIMLGGRAVPPELTAGVYPLVSSSADVVGVVEDLIAGPPQTMPPLLARLGGR